MYDVESKLPWMLTREEFESCAIPSQIATRLVQKNRAGSADSKNRGISMSEPPSGDLVETLIPVRIFTGEYLEYIRDTTDSVRVLRYVDMKIHTPIYAKVSRKGMWIVSDGGHRLLSSIMRDDKYIPALVPVSCHENLVRYAVKRGEYIPQLARMDYNLS